MKILILVILLFISSEILGQIDSTGNQSVNSTDGFYGLIQNGNQYFLVGEKGSLQLNKQNAFQKYYRKIYSDSTIRNPNFIFQSDNEFSELPILPFIYIDGRKFNHKKRKFQK
ncbi:hypothetical protein BMS3Abin04_02444 [bacterium BMS3Abin04]|nr:hypothetical protein BMS3Abin04_02444 [bacterium BMS3Abin04]